MIGKKIKKDGRALYAPEYHDDGLTFGRIFKDEDAFKNRPDDVCYIPEAYFNDETPIMEVDGFEYYDVSGYTRKDLEEMVTDECGIIYYDEDDEPLDLEYFFSELQWACPDTYIMERYH